MTTGGRETLAQRVANSRPQPPPDPDAVPTVKHCWYNGPHGRQPALLLEWRKVGDGYDGRIAVVTPDAAGWALVEMWVDAGLLEPA